MAKKSCDEHPWCGVCRPEVWGRSVALRRAPEAREAASTTRLRWIEDNPDAEAKSTATKRSYPVRLANSQQTQQQWADMTPEEHDQRLVPIQSEETRAKANATNRTPIMRAVASANTRRYYDNDLATGGAQVPGGLRDAHIRARAAREGQQEG